MSSDNTKLYAGVVIALILGAAVGWFAKPAPADMVPKSTLDALQAQYNTAQSQLTQAQAQLAELSKPPKVGIVFATGGLGDKSFNDISFAGAQRAYEELGVEFDYVEPTAIAEYEGYQRDFAMSGDYILIVCIGFDQGDPLTVVASEYPDQNFALVDMVVDKPNIANLVFRANEGSFLTGVVAGLTTTTGKVGFVGGMDIPLIRDFYVGYKAGAEWASPNVQVLEPVFVGDWADPTKGKELAVGLWELGADCIFGAGGKSTLGALEACDEKNINGFGVDSCQDYLNENMVASMTKRVDVAVYEMILDALVGKFQGGFYNGGISEGWVGMCQLPEEKALWEETFDFTHKELPESVMDKVLEAKNKILSGAITVPSGYG